MHRSVLLWLFMLAMAVLPAISSAQAATAWRKYQDNPFFPGFVEPFKMVVEQDLGATFITGITRGGPGRADDIFVARYSANGTLEWFRTFDGGFASNDAPLGIALDSNDNVFVCGFSIRSTNGKDFMLLKYAADGTFQWSRSYHGGGGDDEAQDLVVDKFNNVIVTGQSLSGVTSVFGLATIKFGQTGNVLWVRRQDTDINANIFTSAVIDVDSIGNIFVGCASQGTNGLDITVIRYDLSSAFAWLRRWDHSGQTDGPTDIEVGPDGVYICGSAQEGVNSVAALVKYDFAGNFQWADTFQPTESLTSTAAAMAINPEGIVTYTGGTVYAVGTDIDEVTRSFNPDGSVRWTRDDRSVAPNGGVDIAADQFGNFYVASFTQPSTSDAVLKAYSSSGALRWQAIVNGPSGLDDAMIAVGVDRDANVISTGYSNTPSSRLLMTQKIVQTPVSFPDTFTAIEANTRTFAAPGVASNDWFTTGATANVVTGVTKGTLELGQDGSFTYRADVGATGTDTFTYRLIKGGLVGNTVTVSINIIPLAPASLVFSPSTIFSGQSTTGRVTLNGVAPSGGITVTVTKNSTVLTGPDTVLVPEGATSALFAIKAGPVASSATRTVTVSRGGIARTAPITINPSPALVSLIVSPNPVVGGQNTAGRVTLAAPAPAGGMPVEISDNSTAITTPPVVFIPAGATFVNFTINTSSVTETSVRQVTATLNGVTRTVNVTLNPG